MKNPMFDHLLQYFISVENQIENQEEFRDAYVALRNLTTLISQQENLSKEEFVSQSDMVKKAFQQFKTACTKVMERGRENLTPEMNHLYTHIVGFQKPLDCYIQNLQNGKTLTDTFADSSWMNGIFTDDEAVKDREDYVPGQYQLQHVNSFKDILDAYITEADEVQNTYKTHLKTISGDMEDPSEMIQYKLSLLQDYCDCNNDRPGVCPLNHLIGDGYKIMEKRMNRATIEDYRNNGNMMSDSFFGVEADRIYERTETLGYIDAMKGLPKDALQRIKDETNKLRFKPAKMGVTKEKIERLELITSYIQPMKANIDMLCSDYQDAEEAPFTKNIVSEAKQIFAGVQGYLRGDPGVTAPTDEAFIKFASHLKKKIYDMGAFNTNGSLNDIYKAFYATYQEIYRAVPSIQEQLKKDYAELQNNMLEYYLDQYQELSVSGRTEDEKTAITRGIKDVYDAKLISRETMYDAMYVHMAQDPSYNQAMIEKCQRALKDFIKNRDKEPGYTSEVPFTLNNFLNGEKHTATELYEEVYTMLLVGTKISEERQKLANTEQAPEQTEELKKLKNTPNAHFAEIIGAKKATVKQLQEMHAAMGELKASPVYKSILKLDLETMKKVADSSDVSKEFVRAISSPKQDCLHGVSDKTLSALVQTSGVGYWPNSDSYKRMSDALKDIYKKNATASPAGLEDYKKLYNACWSYTLSHDSFPSSDNGKLRVNAAVNMLHVLGQNLSKADPTFQQTIENDRIVNMARFKTYRDMMKNRALEKLDGLISKHKNQICTDYENLPDGTKKSIEECTKIIGQAEGFDEILKNQTGCEIRGKMNTENAKENMTAQVRSMMDHNNELMTQFHENPRIALGKYSPELTLTQIAKKTEKIVEKDNPIIQAHI